MRPLISAMAVALSKNPPRALREADKFQHLGYLQPGKTFALLGPVLHCCTKQMGRYGKSQFSIVREFYQGTPDVRHQSFSRRIASL